MNDGHPENKWGDRDRIAPAIPAPTRSLSLRLVRINVGVGEEPLNFALSLSGTLDPLLGPPAYTIRIGIGETSFQWTRIPPPPAGGVYIVHCHELIVDLEEFNLGAGTEAIGWAAPTEAPATLTP